MKTVFLLNEHRTPHYRVPVYNRLSTYLEKESFALTIVSEGVEPGNTHPVEYAHKDIRLTFLNLAKLIFERKPDAIIYWVRLRNLYLFPTLLLAKLLRIKLIYWGHGSDLAKRRYMRLKTAANNIEHLLSNAIILYSEPQKLNISRRFHSKTYIANNTLCFTRHEHTSPNTRDILAEHKIHTVKNIVCMGRMQKRKRLDILFKAFSLLNRKDIGLILIGPDTDGVLDAIDGHNVHKLGPIYGDERLDLISSADVFCLPGAVGLGIVDAFHCGLPLVTESGDESPEIMYLKDGVNGFITPRGDVQQLATKLELLLDNPMLRDQFSMAAKREIETNGHIDKMCTGFAEALHFVFHGNTVYPNDAKGSDIPRNH